MRVEDAALPRGTTIAVADLFFNTPARRKFLRAESTELAHVTALVTHYALAHPEKHFELVSASHTIVSAPPVARTAERIYQIFGKETLGQLAARGRRNAARRVPACPSRRHGRTTRTSRRAIPGTLRLTGFYSKPELQKLNRNSIYIFVNKRLIRDRLLLHAITEAYRNVIPPTSFPGGAALSRDAARGGGRERAPGQDRSALPPAEPGARFCPRQPAHGADQGAARRRIPGRARLAADGQPFADAAGSFAACPALPADALPTLPDSDPEAFAGARADAEPFRLTPRKPVARSRQAAV